MKSKRSKVIIIGLTVFGAVFAGSFLVVYAAQVIDSFTSDFFVKDTWNVEVDTGAGEVKLETRECDDSEWFCSASTTCLNYMDDGEYIIVAREDVSTSTYDWKNSQTYCVEPQCEDIGGDTNLVGDNTVNFIKALGEQYPAREACKEAGGRLPTIDELSCIYSNRTEFGDNFASAHYWSATELLANLARWVDFSDGSTDYGSKTSSFNVRCVLGW